MAQTGFGSTLVGVVTGTITNLKEVAVGGYSQNVINFVTLDSEISKNLYGAITRGPITATIVFDKALYEALETALKTKTSESWTLTDAGGNTWIGNGKVTSLGEVMHGADGEDNFTIEVTPDSDWDFTKAS